MRKIDFGFGMTPSVLGFGCAPILGSVDRERSLKALEIAYENGVNYFDVAASYGYGQAEAFLGSFLKGKRDQCYIATKFGIEAHPAAALLGPIKPLVRALKGGKQAGSPSAAGPASSGGGIAGKLLVRKPITAELLTSSLERSLKRLKTDHVDILFIHETHQHISDLDRVLAAAEKMKQAGKLRAFGIASGVKELYETHANVIPKVDLVQFGLPTEAAELDKVRADLGSKSNAIFGAVKARHVVSSANLSVPESMQLLSSMFPRTILLCSMFTPKHIKANCDAF